MSYRFHSALLSALLFTSSAFSTPIPDRVLVSVGQNYSGQLGDGTAQSPRFYPVVIDEDVASVAAGVDHSLYVLTDGSLYAMGSDLFGELCDGRSTQTGGDEDRACTPDPVADFVMSGVKKAVAGGNFTLLLKEDGSLWSCGANDLGQLGKNTSDGAFDFGKNLVPFQIASNVVDVAAGNAFAIYLDDNGRVFGFGINRYGQLGAAHSGDTGAIVSTPQLVAENVSAIAAGGNGMGGSGHILFITKDKKLYGMGCNSFGQLGNGSSDGTGSTTVHSTPVLIAEDVTLAAAGSTHTLFVTSDGVLHGTGSSTYGELGDGWNAHFTTSPKVIPGAPGNIAAIAAGNYKSALLTSEGVLTCAGNNYDGGLGITDYQGNTYTFFTPVASHVTSFALGGCHILYVTRALSAFAPLDERGGKWSADWGWIDDTYYPWIWSYDQGAWFYMYQAQGTRLTAQGHWIAYLTSDTSDYGWGFVFPGHGWWCLPHGEGTVNATWSSFFDPFL
jgi:alpha-tubulin suppressor-like RCC1 family protein